MPSLLFPLAADDLTTLIEQIKALETKISQSDSQSRYRSTNREQLTLKS